LAVLRSQIGKGGLDASATALDRWSHGAIAAHGDDLDALVELAELESQASRFPEWLSAQLSAPADPEGVALAFHWLVWMLPYLFLVSVSASHQQLPFPTGLGHGFVPT